MNIFTSYIPPASSSDPHLSTLDKKTQGSSISNNLLRPRSESSNFHTKLAFSVDCDVLVALNNTPRQVNMSRDFRPSVPERTFAPLTPIIASPITTPSTSTTSSKLYVTVSKEGAKEKLAALHSEISLVGQDYFSKGALVPTPPAKQAILAADPSPLWNSAPPKAERASVGIIEPITYIPPAASLPASSDAHGLSERDNIRKRRASLPLMTIAKPLPPLLSTNTSQLVTSSLRDALPTDKPIKHRAKFSLDSDDCEGIWFDSPEEIEVAVVRDGVRDENHSASEWLKDKNKDNIRRHHVLMELLSTEMGYLMDLRELVNVSATFVMG